MKLNKGLMSISDFATYCGTTRQAMQYYDRIGLLRPLQMGKQGYRYYHPLQGHELRLIHSLQRSGCSLEEVQDILSSGDIDTLNRRIAEKQKELELEQQRIHREQVYLNRVFHFFNWSQSIPEDAPIVYSLQRRIHLEEVVQAEHCGPFTDSYYDMVLRYAEYCRENHTVQLYPYALYVSPEDRESSLHFSGVFAFPEDLSQPTERSVQFPPGDYVCYRSYPSSKTDIRPRVYEAMRKYISENGYRPWGGSYEIPFCIPRGLREPERHFSVVFVTPVTRNKDEGGKEA